MFFDCLDVQRELLEGVPVYALLMGKTQDYPVELFAEYLDAHRDAGRAVLLMGLEAGLLRDGPVERIVDTVRRFVDVLGRDNTLTIYLAGVPADTPPSHVDTAVSAIHAYGQYPIVDHLDTVSLNVAEREPFSEYAGRMSDGAGVTY